MAADPSFSFQLKGQLPYLSDQVIRDNSDVVVSCGDGVQVRSIVDFFFVFTTSFTDFKVFELCRQVWVSKLHLVAVSPLMREVLMDSDRQGERCCDNEVVHLTTERDSGDVLQLAWFISTGSILARDVMHITDVLKEFGIDIKTLRYSDTSLNTDFPRKLIGAPEIML